MNYPMEIATIVSNKTLSVEAHFTKRTEDKPLEIFDDTFSRFVFAVIADGKAAHCNIPVELVSELVRTTNYAYENLLNLSYATSENAPSLPCFTEKFSAGTLKGKTPIDVIRENGEEKGKEILRGQFKFLNENLQKFPANKKLLDAISSIRDADLSNLGNASISAPTIKLVDINCRPLIRKEREDGKKFCYEASIVWDSSRRYPVCITISNYYANVIKTEKGLLNVDTKSKADVITNEMNISARDWLNIADKMQSVKNGFEIINYSNAFKIAEEEAKKNRGEN